MRDAKVMDLPDVTMGAVGELVALLEVPGVTDLRTYLDARTGSLVFEARTQGGAPYRYVITREDRRLFMHESLLSGAFKEMRERLG